MIHPFGDHTREQIETLAKKAGAGVRRHPVAATALAAATVGLISLALTRPWRASNHVRTPG